MLPLVDMQTVQTRLRRRFGKEVFDLGLPVRGDPRTHLAEEQIGRLPATVQRYLRFMNAVGRPRDWSFRVGFHGGFRTSPDGPWLPCEGWQYDSTLGVTRIFHMRVAMARMVPTMVRDTYLLGHGRIQGKVLDLLPVVTARGPEIDMGELVTFLAEAIMFAPTMVLGPMARWSHVDDRSFDVSFTDWGTTVKARVFLDERGAPYDFSTDDRFLNDPYQKGHPLVRARWNAPIDRWTTHDGRPVPAAVRAVWHLPQGAFEYARFEFEDLAYDVAPGQ
ncbi:MAG: DUF6544 family protein [Polyangiales bacterium]